LYTNCI